ncbi:DUF5906 domain-containing protein [Chromobacterium violaceum]|uniref:DUF5906 domain-containing protein n=1 Tax=Chromobacterium violaceum TaxID=536 RepID=UPI001950CDF3|nr:DUF5906 domain-containing protein [Chromobacterium violaceum]QRO34146.1 hypothetical protein I6K04_05220 [Chromobacterium violaceum]QRQ16051.1 hypothetical protein I6K03_17510 [Chromobacterium violaceum]
MEWENKVSELPVPRRVNIGIVADRALDRAAELVGAWLRDGKRESLEWVATNPTRRDKHPGSFKVNLKTGAWSDFALGDAGGDLVSLYAYLFGLRTQVEAARELAQALGLPDSEVYSDAPPAAEAAKPKKSTLWAPVLPVPEDAPLMHKAHVVRGMPQRVAVYRDGAGRLLGAVMRFVTSDGGKDDVPHTFCRHEETGQAEWRWLSFPEPRPLYGLDVLAARPDAPVLLVEGEKCKDVAAAHLDEFVVVSWPGGSKAVAKVDWSPLAGRRVVQWPDADCKRAPLTKAEKAEGVDPGGKPFLAAEAQPGLKAMVQIGALLTGLGCELWRLELPEVGTLPDGWDVADAFEKDGWSAEAARQFVAERRRRVDELPVPAGDMPVTEVPAVVEAEVSAPSRLDASAALRPLLDRFALVHGKKRVFDLRHCEEMSWSAFVAFLKNDKRQADAWLAHKDSKVLMQHEVSRLKRDASERLLQQDQDFSDALQRYVYLDGSSTIWDQQLQKIISFQDLKVALGDAHKVWLNSPMRRKIDRRNLVFDPSLSADPETHINMFRGLPMTPAFPGGRAPRVRELGELVPLFPACEKIIELTMHLCDDRVEVWEWLINWLAFPLQQVGMKMSTALLMHSDVQGSGKSLLFEEVVKPIYGDYGATIDQDHLDGNFSGWRSMKLFCLFEEVTSVSERFTQSGKLKHLITGKTQLIERKFVDAWEEANHLNSVFLSNSALPFHVEASDRRMMVVWPSRKLDEDLQDAVLQEIADGGVEAFYGFLLSVPLMYARDGVRRPFGAHTKPAETPERLRLIALGLAPWEAFLVDWQQGKLGVPYGPCLAYQLYGMYHDWSLRGREKSVLPYRKFGQLVESRIGSRQVKHYRHGTAKSQATLFLPIRCPHGEVEQDWLGQYVMLFQYEARDAGWRVDEWEMYKPAPIRAVVKDGKERVAAL